MRYHLAVTILRRLARLAALATFTKLKALYLVRHAPTPRAALSGVHTTCFEQWDSDIYPLLTRTGCQSVFGRPIRAPYDSLSCLRAPRTYVCTRTRHLHACACNARTSTMHRDHMSATSA